MTDWGVLSRGQYLIHDKDGKYCPAFQRIIDKAGITRVPLPPRSPTQLILFGERALQHALTEYVVHFHQERPHQGMGNVVLMPAPCQAGPSPGPPQCRERLGGLLKYYYREAA
jgi:putative transposase